MRADDPRPDDHDHRDGPEPDPRWVEVADCIATGEAIDWEALAAELDDPAGREVLRSLRTLASIGQLHTGEVLPPRDAPADESDAADDASPAAATRLGPGDRWGTLELIEEIGRGSYGSVWRAHDPGLDREVALKLLHPVRELDAHDRARFLEEGRALARLDHENVVRVHGVGEHRGRVGLWMELVRGRSLAALVRDNGEFGAEEAALIGEKLARALAAVHAAGVVHRDVKAHNVLRAAGGRVVLMDFGAAVPIAPEAPGSTLTGTPLYLAPELLEGQPADARSDVYALGVLLYHLVTGTHPVVASQVSELRGAHREGRRTRLADARADLPAAFVDVVERALRPDPRERFASAGEMAQALASLGPAGASLPGAQRPGPGAPVEGMPATAGTRRAFAPWIVAVAAVLATAVTALTLLDRGGPAGGFSVEASLLRYGESTVEELYSGARLEVGDQLGLRIEVGAPSWVYVFNRDERGRFHVMFPREGIGPQNPLAADRRWELPGSADGETMAWQVDTAGGEEEVLVVVSDRRLDEIERRIGEVGPPIEPRTLEGLRGIGAVVQRRSEATGLDPGAGVFAAVEDLAAGRSTAENGVWIRRLVLSNP